MNSSVDADGLSALVHRLLAAGIDDERFSAASCLIAVDGATVVTVALGTLAAIDDAGQTIPREHRVPADVGSLFDLASVTKIFSAATLLRLVQLGTLRLDEPIAAQLSQYSWGEKTGVTLRHLLTHTSGLPSGWSGWRAPLQRARERIGRDTVLRGTPLSGQREHLEAGLLATSLVATPGTAFNYSCVGYLTAMLLAERVTGIAWPDLVHEHTVQRLGVDGVTFRPDLDRTVATEYQPQLGRGTVRGDVHDELAWSLGGACGNAGLFGHGTGVLTLAEEIRLGRSEIFRESLWDNQLPRIVDRQTTGGESPFGMSLGLRIGESDWMSPAGRHSRGHTGFTGTSIQLDRNRGVSIVLLTNRVHPSREGSGVHPLRAAIGHAALTFAHQPRRQGPNHDHS